MRTRKPIAEPAAITLSLFISIYLVFVMNIAGQDVGAGNKC